MFKEKVDILKTWSREWDIGISISMNVKLSQLLTRKISSRIGRKEFELPLRVAIKTIAIYPSDKYQQTSLSGTCQHNF